MQGEHRITRHEIRPPAPESALATLQLLPRTEQITAVHRLDPRHRSPLLASCTYYSVFSYPYYFIPAQAQGPPSAIAAFLPILIPVVQLQEGRVTDTGGRDPRYCSGEKVQSSLLDLPLNHS